MPNKVSLTQYYIVNSSSELGSC